MLQVLAISRGVGSSSIIEAEGIVPSIHAGGHQQYSVAPRTLVPVPPRLPKMRCNLGDGNRPINTNSLENPGTLTWRRPASPSLSSCKPVPHCQLRWRDSELNSNSLADDPGSRSADSRHVSGSSADTGQRIAPALHPGDLACLGSLSGISLGARSFWSCVIAQGHSVRRHNAAGYVRSSQLRPPPRVVDRPCDCSDRWGDSSESEWALLAEASRQDRKGHTSDHSSSPSCQPRTC